MSHRPAFRVFQHTLGELRRDPRLRWGGALLLALFAVALWTGGQHYAAAQHARAEAQRASYQQWLSQGAKNPHSAAHYGFYAFRPLSLLAVLEPGADDYLGTSVWLEAHKQNDVQGRAAQDAPDGSRFQPLTVGFVWQFLLPLVVLLLAFDSVSREREGGTLRLLLGAGLPPADLLLGKSTALLAAALLYLLLPTLLAAGAALAVLGGVSGVLAALPRLLVLAGLHALLLAGVVGLAVWVSANVRRSGLALVLLLGGWATGAFLVPRLAGSVAQALVYTPSSFAFTEAVNQAKEQGLNGHDPANAVAQQLKARVLRQYGVDSVSQLPVSFAALALQAGEERDYPVYDRHYGQLFTAFDQQTQVLATADALSPLLAAHTLAQALAGTDVAAHLDFTQQAEALRRRMQCTLNGHMASHAAGQDYDYQASASLWQQIPPFQYQPAALGTVLARRWPALLALGLWVLLPMLLLRQTAHRLRPE